MSSYEDRKKAHSKIEIDTDGITLLYRVVVIQQDGKFGAICLEKGYDSVQGDTMSIVLSKIAALIKKGGFSSSEYIKRAINHFDHVEGLDFIRLILLKNENHYEVRCLEKKICVNSDHSLSNAISNYGEVHSHLSVLAKVYFENLGRAADAYQELWRRDVDPVDLEAPVSSDPYTNCGEALTVH